jgi:hypothetical protein
MSMLANLTKAAVAVAVSPIALVADLVTLPASSMDPHRGPFERTGNMLNTAGECVTRAIAPAAESKE